MQIVIRLDLGDPSLHLQETMETALRSAMAAADLSTAEAGESGEILDRAHRVLGTWEIEEGSSAASAPHPRTRDYRDAAVARFARAHEVEIDRFAPVSVEPDGAFVQGWLFVPQADLQALPPAKPPRSISSTGDTRARTA